MKLSPRERELRARPSPYMLSYSNPDASSPKRFQMPGFDVWVYKVVWLSMGRFEKSLDGAVRFGEADAPSGKQILRLPVSTTRPVAVRLSDGQTVYASTAWIPAGWYVPAGTVVEIDPQTAVVLFGMRA